MKRSELVAVGRELLDTPFHHQGLLKGVGIDCRGVIIYIARAFGIEARDVSGYSRQPNPAVMGAALREQMVEIPIALADIGDVLWLAFAKDPMHLVVRTDIGILHATTMADPPRVIEHSFRAPWTNRVRAAFAFPGVE